MTFRSITARDAASLPGVPRLPLVVPSAAVGVAIAGMAAWAYAASRGEVLLAASLAGPILSVVLYRRSIQASLEASRLALTDRLTGLGNDRHFLERLGRDLDRVDAEGGTLALCLIDVDDFKRINDRFGHPAGDRVLVEIASSLRHGGEAFRIGGDELALLVAGCDESAALGIADAVLARIASAEYGHGEAVTASAGVVVYPDHGVARADLVRAADSALYRAKGDGKSCARPYRSHVAAPPPAGTLDDATHAAIVFEVAAGLARAARAQGAGRGALRAAGDLAARVAARMALDPRQVELVRLAATLNDIGKLALPDDLLAKPGPLTEEERRLVERHPEIGSALLGSLGAETLAAWILHHHERWDGDGYPERLAGERIPLAARILFVADAYEAMTSDQAWRPSLSAEEAIAELRRCAGTQFDPVVVEAFAVELGVYLAGAAAATSTA